MSKYRANVVRLIDTNDALFLISVNSYASLAMPIYVETNPFLTPFRNGFNAG